jgi:Ca2+-binding EF-hand superfamily protein
MVWRMILLKADEDPIDWVESIEKTFKMFDVDDSGELNVAEVGNFVRSLGITMSEEQLEAFIQEFEMDYDRRVSLSEFKKAVEKHKPRDNAAGKLSSVDAAWNAVLHTIEKDPKFWNRSLENIFGIFDRDSSGSLDICELQTGLVRLGVRLSADQV